MTGQRAPLLTSKSKESPLGADEGARAALGAVTAYCGLSDINSHQLMRWAHNPCICVDYFLSYTLTCTVKCEI